jgi:hypothetical protein
MLRGNMVAQLLFGGGMVAAPALITMVQVDRLGLGMHDIALAGLVAFASTTIAIGAWGRVASRLGPLPTVAAGTTLGAISLALFALTSDLGMVLVASALLGASGAAIDVSWPLLIADHAVPGEEAAAAAGLHAIMGVRGLIAPFVVMLPVHAGVLDELGGLLVCVLAAGAGAIMYARLAGLPRRLRRVAASVVTRPQSRPASARTPASSSSGWPVIRRSRLMRSTIAGWVLKRPLALLSSFLTGLTT